MLELGFAQKVAFHVLPEDLFRGICLDLRNRKSSLQNSVPNRLEACLDIRILKIKSREGFPRSLSTAHLSQGLTPKSAST